MAIPVPEKRIAEFENLGFGMFIHYGLYSQLGRGEWVQHIEKIPKEEYMRFQQNVALYDDYTKQEVESEKHPIYKATGMAYIRFAKEEKELFKLLFMRDTSKENTPSFSKEILEIVQSNTGLDGKSAELFQLEIWAFVHGIAAMLATNYLELDTALISDMITDVFQGGAAVSLQNIQNFIICTVHAVTFSDLAIRSLRPS